MVTKRKVEIFSAGCPACDKTVELVKRIACPSCEVIVRDMNDPSVAMQAHSYGVTQVPSVVIDGKLSSCCAGGGPDEATLRQAGIGTPQ